MSAAFIYHIIISGIIFYLLGTGQKLFIKLKGTVDFSYLGIIIFWSYTATLLNMHRGWNMLAAIGGAFALSLLFTFLIVYLSWRLDEVYFAIGTLALYILSNQLSHNLEHITGWPFGLSGMTRNLRGIDALYGLEWYLIFAAIICVLIMALLMYFKKTYFFTILQWRGEREVVITSLWVKTTLYKLVLIIITTLIAVVWWGLYSFYLNYIDPTSFWLSLLILTITIAFLSYRFNEIWTFLVWLAIIGWYEWLRFFKIVDPSNIGYFREIVFAILIMVASYWIFKTTTFGRET